MQKFYMQKFYVMIMNLVFQFNVAIKRNLISEQGIRTVFF